MTPEILDILLVENVWLRDCNDARPCVVIDSENGQLFGAMLVSSADDLVDRNMDFKISVDHTDFKFTGLKKTSYVKGYRIFTIRPEMIVKIKGRLVGDLKIEFKRWLGLD